MSRATRTVIVLGVVVIGGALWFSQRTGAPPAAQTTVSPTLSSSPMETPSPTDSAQTLQLTSSAFANNQPIPALYTCDGQNTNPPLAFSGIPPVAQSLVLIVDDPDAPNGTWDHWVVYDIPPTTTDIAAGETPSGTVGKGSQGDLKYQGPCPPSGQHHYHFKLYALDARLELAPGATKQQVEQAMTGHILEQTELIGLYQKS